MLKCSSVIRLWIKPLIVCCSDYSFILLEIVQRDLQLQVITNKTCLHSDWNFRSFFSATLRQSTNTIVHCLLANEVTANHNPCCLHNLWPINHQLTKTTRPAPTKGGRQPFSYFLFGKSKPESTGAAPIKFVGSFQGRRRHGGREGSCPRCPDGTGAARGQEVPFQKNSLVYPLHLKLLTFWVSAHALHLCQDGFRGS